MKNKKQLKQEIAQIISGVTGISVKELLKKSDTYLDELGATPEHVHEYYRIIEEKYGHEQSRSVSDFSIDFLAQVIHEEEKLLRKHGLGSAHLEGWQHV